MEWFRGLVAAGAGLEAGVPFPSGAGVEAGARGAPYNLRRGLIIVRHMWAVGLAS